MENLGSTKFLQKGLLYINLHYAQIRFWHVYIALQDFSYQLLENFFAWNRIGQPIFLTNLYAILSSHRNQSNNLQCESIDWCLYDWGIDPTWSNPFWVWNWVKYKFWPTLGLQKCFDKSDIFVIFCGIAMYRKNKQTN